MDTREVIKKQLLETTTGVIEFRSYHGRAGHSRLVYPMIDKLTKWYKGVPKITKEMRDSGEAFVDPLDETNPLSSYRLEHMNQLDLSVPTNRMILAWLVECDSILALMNIEGKNNPKMSFYVYNEILESERRISKLQLKDKAIEVLKEIPSDDLANVARLLGYDLRNRTPESIRLYLRELLEESKWESFAERFLQKIVDPNKAMRIFLINALDKEVIVKNSRDEYMFGDIFLGASAESVIEKFNGNRQEDRDIILEIQSRLGENIPKTKRK